MPYTTNSIQTDSSPYVVLVDNVTTSNVMYIGKAIPGTATSSPYWQIAKLDQSNTPITIQLLYAGGTKDFKSIFDNRASLSYS